MKKIRIYLVLLILLSGSISIENYAYANGGPTSEGPSEMSAIFFNENSNISLVEETILFSNIERDSRQSVAKVSIDYKLKNMDDSVKNLNVFFIVPQNSTDFNIIMNDFDITESCIFKEIPLPSNWIPSSTDALYNPENGDILSSYYYDNEGNYLSKIWGVEIPVSINSNEYATLNVEYKSYGGFYSGKKVKNTVYGFMYYLSPAKFWNGTPNVTLKIELPSNDKYLFNSNIPLEKIENGCYEAHLKDIPDSEWLFSYNSKAGLIYGTNNPSLHSKINISVSLLILICFAIFSNIIKKEVFKIVGYIISVLIFFGYTGKMIDGYLGDTLVYMFLFLLLIIIVPIIYIIIRYYMKRKLKTQR